MSMGLVVAAWTYRGRSGPTTSCGRLHMTRDEALKEIDQLCGTAERGVISQQEIRCPDMKEAARILSLSCDRIRKRDPLYGNVRRTGLLSPPPGLVPPG
jgi:hypothetical protein